MSEYHAPLSPSGAKRYLTCTASVEACKNALERETEYSKAGTEADALLMRAIDSETHPRSIDPSHKDISAVSLAYEYLETYIKYPDCIVETQVRVAPPVDKYGEYVAENQAGTLDILVVHTTEKWLAVIDYKNGYQTVEPTDPQLLIYSIGALDAFDLLYDIETVIRGVIQPNSPHDQGPIRNIQNVKEKVVQEYEETVLPIVLNIQQGIVEFVPSEEACMFCDARYNEATGGCAAFNNVALKKTRSMFSDQSGALVVPSPEEIRNQWTPEMIASAIEGQKLFDMFWDTINDLAQGLAKQGKLPGYKRIAGRKSRSFDFETETEQLEFMTKVLKLKKSECYTQKILSVAQTEKLIDPKKRGGKKKKEELDARIVEKTGNPKLVKENHPNPSIDSYFKDESQTESEDDYDPLA